MGDEEVTTFERDDLCAYVLIRSWKTVDVERTQTDTYRTFQTTQCYLNSYEVNEQNVRVCSAGVF